MNRAYVLLVNWNGWGDTVECLESLFRYLPDGTRVIICDNDSSDGSIEKIQAWAEGRLDALIQVDHPLRALSWPPVVKPVKCRVYDRNPAEQGGEPGDTARLVMIRTGANLGFAGGNNVGLRYVLARGDAEYVWLLNNDTVIAPGALEALFERVAGRPDVGMCGSTLLRYDVPDRVQVRGGGWYCKWIGLPWHLGQLGRAGDLADAGKVERRMNYVVGASLFVSKPFLEQVGLVCEDYFLFFEEIDWALRSKGRFTLAYAAESTVYHKVGRSIGTSSLPGRKSYTCDYYSLRNRLYFTRSFYPHALPAIYTSLAVALLVRVFCGKWDRAGLIWKLLFGDGDRMPKTGLR